MAKKIVRRRRMSSTKENIQRKENFQYILILEGVAVGFLAGLIVSMFRFAFIKAESMRDILVEAASHKITVGILGTGLLLFLLITAAASFSHGFPKWHITNWTSGCFTAASSRVSGWLYFKSAFGPAVSPVCMATGL